MKRLLAITVVLCMTLLIFTSCGKNKKSDTQSLKEALDDIPVTLDSDVSKLLEDLPDADIPDPTKAKIKVSVTLPEGWEEEENDYSIANYMKGPNAITIYEAWSPSGVKDPKGLAEYEKEQLKGSFKDSVFHDIEDTKVAGYDAARMPIDIAIAGIKQRQTYIYFKKGNSFFKIMMAHFLDEDEEVLKEMDSIIESLKVE